MKRSLRTSDVCRQLDIQPYVLKYWESEFPQLLKSAETGPRTYAPEEVALLRRIKQLLYEEGYTIAGARKKLAQESGAPTHSGPLFEGPRSEVPSSHSEVAPDPVLDSSQAERIKTLERGLRELLEEAQNLLESLGHPSAEKPRRSGRGAAW